MSLATKIVGFVFVAVTLSACGSSGTTPTDVVSGTTPTVSYSTLKVWTDGAGVGRGEASDGSRGYLLAPDIVELVAAANAAGEPDSPNPEDFPVSTIYNGYELREGVLNGSNVIAAIPDSGNSSQLVYIYSVGYEALAVGVPELGSIPAGTFNYDGIYIVEYRPNFSLWKEIGTLAMTTNFSNGTFTINASGDDTSLTGSGYVDTSSGQLSGSGFAFNYLGYQALPATIVGGLGGTNAEGVVGVFYTTEDNDPEFAGGFAGQR